MSRPSVDDLKRARDGHTSAGRYQPGKEPACDYCGERTTEEKGRVRAAGNRTVETPTGGRRGETIYAHEGCPNEEQAVNDRERWFAKLRGALYARHQGERVTADDVARLMEDDPALARPSAVHPNAMGMFFQTWEAAKPVMVGEGEDQVQLTTMSPRERNRLCVWRLT